MRTYGISAACLIRELLVREGLCDYPRAGEVASKLDREIRQIDCFETEDGATFVRTRTGCAGNSGHLASSQLSFRSLHDVGERN